MRFDNSVYNYDDFEKYKSVLEELGKEIENFSKLRIDDFFEIDGLLCLETRKYALSKQIKNVYFGITRQAVDVHFEFLRNGELEMFGISNKDIVRLFSKSNLFDGINFTYDTLNRVNFLRNREPVAQIKYRMIDGECVITSYIF